MAHAWTEAELAYLAGIIDGEGCFTLHHLKGTHRFSCQLQIGNTDLRLLDWVRTRFGGSVNYERRNNPRHKTVWRWVAHAKDMDALIAAILPYLIVKKSQAELLLAYRRTLGKMVNSKRSTHDIPAHVKTERERIHMQLAVLNRRGA